ncbi:hypothetical protein, partial [Klebsiella variicola]|uniref:hypothetical protein n=1 Tax=Klebsiella variicola TaxID=244366 RepID=UPI0027316943
MVEWTHLSHPENRACARFSALPMSLSQSLLLIVALILTSAFFSVAEVSLAASRRLRLRQM